MQITLNYSHSQLLKTAEYIWENNTSVHKWDRQPRSAVDIVRLILQEMRKTGTQNARSLMQNKGANVWSDYVGTGGYYLLFEMLEHTADSIMVGVTILVDLSVSNRNIGMVSEQIDTTV